MGGYIDGSRLVNFGFDFSHFVPRSRRSPARPESPPPERSTFVAAFARVGRTAHVVARTRGTPVRARSIAKEFDRREPERSTPRTRSRVDETDARTHRPKTGERKRDREEIPELSSGPRRGEAVYDGDAMTTNGFATPFKEGTIKHACYVALERAGAEGLTVRARDDGPGAILDAGGGCPMGVRLVLRHGP